MVMECTMRKHRGFTLLELMAVVVIVSILAVVAVVTYKKYQVKARLMEGYGYINQLRIKQEAYYATYSQYVTASSDIRDFYPFSVASTIPYKIPGTAWGIDCSSSTGVHADGFCALGFSPGNYTNWTFVVLGWRPTNPPDPGNCIHDQTKPWWVIRVVTGGSEGTTGSSNTVSDSYELRATSETNNVYKRYCNANSSDSNIANSCKTPDCI